MGRTNFIWVGQNFSEIFYPIGEKFSENFCLRAIFGRTKIPVTILLCTLLNATYFISFLCT